MAVERVITVEYLEPSMSRELLCRFPDASAFGFDYSQSGIWSPLVPRRQASFFSDASPPRKRRRVTAPSPVERLLFREETELLQISGVTEKDDAKQVGSNCSTSLHSPRLKSTTMKYVKGWGKVLKAASKRFKRPRGLPIKLSIF